MGIDGVPGIQDSGHATLCVVGATLVQRSLGQGNDAGGIGEPQGQAQTGGSAADDQHIGG